MSQAKNLLGISIPNDEALHWLIYNLFANIGKTHWPTLVFGVVCMIFFIIFQFGFIKYPWKSKKKFVWHKFQLRKLPYGLLMVILGTLTIYLMKVIGNYKPDDLDLKEVYGIKVIGKVESGLPVPMFPIPSDFSWAKFQELVLVCIPIAFIGYLEVMLKF